MTAGRATDWGRWADALTWMRLVLVVPLGLTAFQGEWEVAAVLLSTSWWSDFFDGRLARRSLQSTVMGQWDMTIDTLVGGALVTGAVLGGHIPVWVGALAALFAVGAALWRNISLAMLVQAIGYAPVLWFVLQASLWASLVALGTISLIAVIDRRKLVEWTLPTFFGGLLGRRSD